MLQQFIYAQAETFSIKKALFSSDKYDEFSPVFYKNGIVFCADRSKSKFVNYSGSDNKGPYKIFFIDTTGNVKWRRSELLSKRLRSKMNDGPVTFNSTFDTIYFSRNQRIDGRFKYINSKWNKLGIFNAVFVGKNWTNVREIRVNNEWFNITTPYLSPDGSKLFFASDRPDGYGGSDIYYSQRRNGYWNDPVNIGPLVNTKGNESYPSITEAGELFFSSDGHQGMGGKDIFVTKHRVSGWYPPVRLDAPVNSEYDDFGIVTDPLIKEGYFSSNRGKTIDIYHFKSNLFHIWFSEPQKKNLYCFTISDTGSILVDTLRLQHVWDFGDGSRMNGTIVRHCFPGPGMYSINLDIIDRRTGKLFFRKLSYQIEIVNIDQPYITSSDVVVAGETFELDGLKSFCQGYTITGYYWDFGDGTNGIGERVNHKFSKGGEFDVRMGVTLKSQTTGKMVKRSVSKRIRVLQGEQERASSLAGTPFVKPDHTDIRQFENIRVKEHYSAETDFRKEAVFQVELLSSGSSTALNSTFFRNVPAKYSVKEIFDTRAGLYSYIVDQQMSLMAAYPAYREMIAAGYSNARVRLYVLNDPAEKLLYNLKNRYGLLTDNYFDANNNLVINAYLILNQIAGLINKYPGIRLEISVYTDNQGIPANNLSLSQARAQMMVNYLIGTGISSNRLVAKGYGGTRPVASNMYISGRRLNRRIDFRILNK